MLTSQEKEQIDNLKVGFHIVKESTNYNLMSSRRVDASRIWAKRLLRAALVLNVLSVVIMFIALGIAAMKPEPEFYASTPSGDVIYLKTIRN